MNVQAEAEAVAGAAWDASAADLGLSLAALVFLPWLVGLALLAGILEGMRRAYACEGGKT